MASVGITRDDLDGAGLRVAAAGTRDARQARRLLAMVLDGHPRQLAAQAGGMDRQTLRDWVCRYNAHGVEGVRDASRAGRPLALSIEQMQTLKELILAGPNLKEDGVVRWRCVDLRERGKAKFEVEVHERTVGKPDEALASSLLHKLGMTRLQPRPFQWNSYAAILDAWNSLMKDAGRITSITAKP